MAQKDHRARRVFRSRGILDASRVSKNLLGQELSPYSGFRKHGAAGSLDGRARRVGSADLRVTAGQRGGAVAHGPAGTAFECSNHHAKIRRRRARAWREEEECRPAPRRAVRKTMFARITTSSG